MFLREDHDTHSTAFPIGLLLLAVAAILAYLAVGGAWSNNKTQTAVYTPQITENSKPR
ncbi:hypothetical protein [Sinorhizobium fredii]|uniref:Uncharacterized protein n=1 Tax=Rhizobium fredii TaxID=380 RepID=A0A2A6M419_RHIFR|nr:hypothetical protein [Sinorhizobium fredii]ASY69041.1 hypothetical protein SF83666_c16240 [Sinorhizobium fredii CCBAU 83666]PDT49206.1 hypothetical protein CO661_04840 [Sinorhizobium fredii]